MHPVLSNVQSNPGTEKGAMWETDIQTEREETRREKRNRRGIEENTASKPTKKQRVHTIHCS
jgi:hypothetical protein